MRLSEQRELLDELLAEESFWEESLARTIRRARGKRRIRHTQVALVGLAVLVASVMLPLKRNTVIAPTTSGDGGAATEVVSTRPLQPGRLVTSKPTSVAVVATKPGRIIEIPDEELLAIVPGETKLLVWYAPGQAELLVLDGDEAQ
jgi:hypothetical protein